MIHIAMIEDDPKASQTLLDYLKKYGEEKKLPLDIKTFPNAVIFLDGYDQGYDIVFMDIDLPYLNGMEAAKKLREKDSEVLLFFVTNLAQFAVKGYEVDALDFLVKPVTYYNLVLKMSRALSRLSEKEEQYIWINTRQMRKRIPVSSLLYIEVMKHTLTYHTTEGNFECYGTMRDAKASLAGQPFSLCNSCYLVNLKHVSCIENYWCYIGDDKLQISQHKRSEFLRDLNNYLAGGNGH